MKNLTYNKLNKVVKMKMSEFVEKYMNIKLFDYQKSLIDNYNPNIIYYLPARGGNKRLMKFYNACRYLSYLKDNDTIIVAKPDGWEKMNKNKFATYLLNKYW